MCPPNVVELADRAKIALMWRDGRRARQAMLLEVRARWHWWRLERADDAVLAQTRALGRVSAATRELREEFFAEHPERDEVAAGQAAGGVA